jgi:hypothetical protein
MLAAVKRAVIMAMIASTLLAGLSNASATGPAEKTKGGDGEASEAVARSMDAPYLAVPVVRDGQLVNYLFVSVRIEISNSVDLWRTRERAHFLRDALVRASHANDLASAEDTDALNEARAIEVYRAAAVQVLGEQAVGRVIIVASYSSRGSGV